MVAAKASVGMASTIGNLIGYKSLDASNEVRGCGKGGGEGRDLCLCAKVLSSSRILQFSLKTRARTTQGIMYACRRVYLDPLEEVGSPGGLYPKSQIPTNREAKRKVRPASRSWLSCVCPSLGLPGIARAEAKTDWSESHRLQNETERCAGTFPCFLRLEPFPSVRP